MCSYFIVIRLINKAFTETQQHRCQRTWKNQQQHILAKLENTKIKNIAQTI